MCQKMDSYKLRELRSKTDRQLLAVIRHQLGAALNAANSYDQELQVRAMAVHDELCRLLPLVYDLAPGDRRRLESELGELADLLNAAA